MSSEFETLHVGTTISTTTFLLYTLFAGFALMLRVVPLATNTNFKIVNINISKVLCLKFFLLKIEIFTSLVNSLHHKINTTKIA